MLLSRLTENAYKTAVITGASSGIGRETAIVFFKAGWNVVIIAPGRDALETTRNKALETALSGPPKISVIAGSVTDEAFVEDLFAQVQREFGRIDVLFNNAGITATPALLEDVTLQTFQDVISVNVTGAFLCSRAAFRVFKSQNPMGGRIINNGSITVRTPRPGSVAYTVSKHAITGLTRTTALDGRAFNIACSQIDIGKQDSLCSSCHTTRSGVPLSSFPDGVAGSRTMPEAKIDVRYVAEAVVYMASLPTNVSVPEMCIMYANVCVFWRCRADNFMPRPTAAPSFVGRG
ncbi:NAD(P)-binding protein [Fistulina hepatica ATCC 64428]|uniref:NAD(P)-binding protein n=1 Tax=Fistulina hepatica ATCC 64428 TaxID=1128425 RepID=A0A0D7ABP7_9AGAR|nr:NAD(P)-binding protein [Fistulina hepatica ATCC 64428]KIY48100.1 NAD(P)-binding protein [Fistulina hepatica ATCC 64428]